MSEWRPIEIAPSVGKKKLIFYTKYKDTIIGYRVAGTNNVISGGSSYRCTHWQSLPPPPEA